MNLVNVLICYVLCIIQVYTMFHCIFVICIHELSTFAWKYGTCIHSSHRNQFDLLFSVDFKHFNICVFFFFFFYHFHFTCSASISIPFLSITKLNLFFSIKKCWIKFELLTVIKLRTTRKYKNIVECHRIDWKLR